MTTIYIEDSRNSLVQTIHSVDLKDLEIQDLKDKLAHALEENDQLREEIRALRDSSR